MCYHTKGSAQKSEMTCSHTNKGTNRDLIQVFSLVTQTCPTLCDPMDTACQACLIINSWSLLKLMSIRSVMPSNHLIFCRPFSFCFQSCPASGSFPLSQFFLSGGQSIGASASASVLPMNIQDWFLLGWTGSISLQSKELSRVFSNTTVESINSSVLSFLHSPTLASIHDHWKNHSLD